MNSATKAAGLGGVALFAVIFYASGIPRVQRDILQVWIPSEHSLAFSANKPIESAFHRQLLHQRDSPRGQRKWPQDLVHGVSVSVTDSKQPF